MDIRIRDNGTGGDFYLVNGEIVMCDGLLNESYLAHFGGNTEAITTGEELDNEERLDWWGNVFMPDSKHFMNSELEKALSEVTINASGRKYIENKGKDDLKHISEIAKVECNVYLDGNDRIKIVDKINSLVIVTDWNNNIVSFDEISTPINDNIPFVDAFTDGSGDYFTDGEGQGFI